MFKARMLSGIVLVAVLAAFGIVGGKLLLAGLGVVSLMGLYELYRVFGVEKSGLGYGGAAVTVLYYAGLGVRERIPGLSAPAILFLMVVLLLILVMAVYVLAFPRYHANQVMEVFFGFFYVAVLLSCVYLTRIQQLGQYLVWLVFLCSWGCDTCAYCVGMLFGKHKMAPVLSPKKSVEGAVGGAVGTAVLTLVYGLVFQEAMGISNAQVFLLAGVGILGALISMVGDLAASAIKRNYEIKDYGKLIPGHGGILDRFDSVIFTAPVIYLFSLFFGI